MEELTEEVRELKVKQQDLKRDIRRKEEQVDRERLLVSELRTKMNTEREEKTQLEEDVRGLKDDVGRRTRRASAAPRPPRPLAAPPRRPPPPPRHSRTHAHAPVDRSCATRKSVWPTRRTR